MHAKRRRRLICIAGEKAPWVPTEDYFVKRRAELLALGHISEKDIVRPYRGFGSGQDEQAPGERRER